MTVNHRVAGSSPAWGASFCKQLPILPTYRKTKLCHSFTLHPDIVKVIKSTAEEERLPMSIVADEALYAGLKALGRMD